MFWIRIHIDSFNLGLPDRYPDLLHEADPDTDPGSKKTAKIMEKSPKYPIFKRYITFLYNKHK